MIRALRPPPPAPGRPAGSLQPLCPADLGPNAQSCQLPAPHTHTHPPTSRTTSPHTPSPPGAPGQQGRPVPGRESKASGSTRLGWRVSRCPDPPLPHQPVHPHHHAASRPSWNQLEAQPKRPSREQPPQTRARGGGELPREPQETTAGHDPRGLGTRSHAAPQAGSPDGRGLPALLAPGLGPALVGGCWGAAWAAVLPAASPPIGASG